MTESPVLYIVIVIYMSPYTKLWFIKDTTINKTDWSKVAMMSVDMFPCNVMENRSKRNKGRARATFYPYSW